MFCNWLQLVEWRLSNNHAKELMVTRWKMIKVGRKQSWSGKWVDGGGGFGPASSFLQEAASCSTAFSSHFYRHNRMALGRACQLPLFTNRSTRPSTISPGSLYLDEPILRIQRLQYFAEKPYFCLYMISGIPSSTRLYPRFNKMKDSIHVWLKTQASSYIFFLIFYL